MPDAPSVLGEFKCLNQMYICDYYCRMSVFVIIIVAYVSFLLSR